MTIIVWVLEWLAVPAIRYAAVALGALAIGGLWRHDVKVAAGAETAVIERSEVAGKKAEAKAAKAHRAAAKPGAAARVLQKYCRDCEP